VALIVGLTLFLIAAVVVFARMANEWHIAPWTILIGGAFAASALVIAELSDPASRMSALREELLESIDPARLTDLHIRNNVTQAIEHRIHMENVALSGDRRLRAFMTDTLARVDTWLAGIGRLAQVLEELRVKSMLDPAARKPLLDRVHDLEDRIRLTKDQRVLDQLRSTLAGRRHQLRLMENLDSLSESALLRLERAVAALGAIDAQLTIAGFQGESQQGAVRIVQEINEETRELEATLKALDRVYEMADISPDLESAG
jgi:hypothetical protein